MTMRLRMQKSISPVKDQLRDIKIGLGGLVDIEFSIQYLLLVNGNKNKSFRSNNVINGLRILFTKKKLSKDLYETLKDNYLFFTKLQNRLRLISNFANNLLPENENELLSLSRPCCQVTRKPG